MTDASYTAITFPVAQGFIEKSRKLRDLYGSSFILSYLARAICKKAASTGHHVISPAIVNLVQGTPNQIIIEGNFQEQEANAAFYYAWKSITRACRFWIEDNIQAKYSWKKDWQLWENHAWEFFWAQGDSIDRALFNLNQKKLSRDWTGVNWMGESSTLSGVDAIAFPGMSRPFDPRTEDFPEEEVSQFYAQLRNHKALGEAFVNPREHLSIPELVKRLITYYDIANKLKLEANELPQVEIPKTFSDLNPRLEEKRWTGWFQGDGDRVGRYLHSLALSSDPQAERAKTLTKFSADLLNWSNNTLKESLDKNIGRIIYTGGDNFLGVLYSNESQLTPLECLQWLYNFPTLWQQHGHKITVSVGFVWPRGGVPQREILQHCQYAENSAKQRGRDRLAIRILFNSRNWIEWLCPWWFLEQVLSGYRDRNGGQNWRHIYNDIATLASRHAFAGNQSDVALGLFDIYFPSLRYVLCKHLWNDEEKTGILGASPEQFPNINVALNDWIVNLAKVGFHLM